MEQNGLRQIQQWLTGFAATQILLCSDELGVFEALRAGPQEIDGLAAALHLPAESLERLLTAAAAMGMLQRNGTTFSLTPLARTHLLRGGQYAGGMFHHIKHHLYPLWHHLDDAIREQKPQWTKLPGMKDDPFSSMYQDPEALRGFMEAMYGMTCAATQELLESGFSFDRYRHVMDVGGAAGGFLIPVLQRHPHLRGTIFDLAAVQPIAEENFQKARLDGRLRFTAGDFFRDPLPQDADLIALGHILHDWNRADGTALLKKVYETLPSGGAVLVHEFFLDDTRDGPFFPAFLSLNMLVATHGKELTAREYEEWLQEVGFRRTETWRGSSARGYALGWKE